MKIQILGTGCPKCKTLTQLTEQAAKDLQIDCQIEKVTEIDQILAFGVMTTPALVIDGVVKTAGKLPTLDEIKKCIEVSKS